MKVPVTCAAIVELVFNKMMQCADAPDKIHPSVQSFKHLLNALCLIQDGVTNQNSVAANLIKVFEISSEHCKNQFLENIHCFSSSAIIEALIAYMNSFLEDAEQEHLAASATIQKTSLVAAFQKCPKKYFQFADYSQLLEAHILRNNLRLDEYATQLFVFVASLANTDAESFILCKSIKISELEALNDEDLQLIMHALFRLGTQFSSSCIMQLPTEDSVECCSYFECLIIFPALSVPNLSLVNLKCLLDLLSMADFISIFEQFFGRFSLFFQEKYPLAISKLLDFAKTNKLAEIFEILFNFGSDFNRQDIVDSLLTFLGSSKPEDALFSLNVFQLFDQGLLRDYICFLKITIDNLENTNESYLPGLFALITGLFHENLHSDSFFNETSIFLKKQLTSKKTASKYVGIKGIISIVDALTKKGSIDIDTEEYLRQPSQSTQLFVEPTVACNTRTEGPCADLLHALCTSALRDADIAIVLIQELLSIFDDCSPFLSQQINVNLVPYLCKKYFIDLQDDCLPDKCTEAYELNTSMASRTVLIHDESAALLPFLLDYLCKTELAKKEDLSELYHLLVCSVSFDSSNHKSFGFVSNWFKALCNNFGIFAQYDVECKSRLLQLSTLNEASINVNHDSNSPSAQMTIDCKDFPLLWDISKAIKKTALQKPASILHNLIAQNSHDYQLSLKIILKFAVMLDFASENDVLLFLFKSLSLKDEFDDDHFGNLLKVFSHLSTHLHNCHSSQDKEIDYFSWCKVLLSLLTRINSILRKYPNFLLNDQEMKLFFKNNRHLFHLQSCNLLESFIDFCKINQCPSSFLIEEFSVIFSCYESCAFLSEKINDFVAFYLSTIDDFGILEKAIQDFTDLVIKNPSEYIQIYLGLWKYLSEDHETSSEAIFLKTSLFKACVTIVTDNSQYKEVIKLCLKYSKKFIDLYIKSFLSIFQKKLKDDDASFVTETLKSLQAGTRTLHQICIFVKSDAADLLTFVPGLKKSLELLLFKIKEMLQTNGMLGAFWLGNLKQKTLAGDVIYSQIAE